MKSNLYAVTPRQMTKYVEEILKAGLVPFVTSSPGEGKSTIVKQIANKFNLEFLDIRLSTMESVDLN